MVTVRLSTPLPTLPSLPTDIGRTGRSGSTSNPAPKSLGDAARASLQNHAPLAATLPRPRASTSGNANPSLDLTARKQNNRTGLDLNKVADNVQTARSVGVDVAKRTFCAKLGGIAVSALVLVGAVLITGGLGVIPLVVAGVMLTKLSADAACAGMALKNARAQARGDPPPYKLPMGADAIGNAVHKMLPADWSSDRKEKIATWTSFGVTAALSVAAGMLTADSLAIAIPAAVTHLGLTTGLLVLSRSASSKAEVGLQNADGQAVMGYAKIGEKLAKAAQKLDDISANPALTDGNRERLKKAIEDDMTQLLDKVDALALNVESKTLSAAKSGVKLATALEGAERGAENAADHLGVDVLEPLIAVVRLGQMLGKVVEAKREQLEIATDQAKHLERTKTLHNEIDGFGLPAAAQQSPSELLAALQQQVPLKC